MQNQKQNWINWLALGICSIISLVGSYFLVKSMKYGLALIGGASGAALALLICSSFGVSQAALFWSILGVSALLFTFLTFKKSDHFMIFSTSLMGSYILVRGVSLFAGGYPNEFELVQELQVGAYDKIPDSFYVYLGFNVISIILGSYYQVLQWNKEGPGYKHPYHYL
jgi:hypothetical protein